MDPAELAAVKERAAAYRRLHDARAAALADTEWARIVDENPDVVEFKNPDVEKAFRSGIKNAYDAALKDTIEEAQAAMDYAREKRQLRETGGDPEQKN